MSKTCNNYFTLLNGINVNEHVEKKGSFNYLSWPFAVQKLREFDPSATWEVKRFNGLPYLQTDLGYFVEVSVKVDGTELSQIHPVLDTKNRPIPMPSPFDINTSIMRCLVKAIALHGLGLSIYAGEDLPANDPAPASAPAPVETMTVEQQAHVLKLLREVGGEMSRVLTYFKVAKLSDIPATDYERVLRSLQRGKKRENVPAAGSGIARVA